MRRWFGPDTHVLVGHGKGPWDGIGAVIKRLLRRLELQGKISALCARHVFDALMQHESQWKKDISSRYKLAGLFFHYISVYGEESTDEEKGADRVWGPITRPRNPPKITAVDGCRSHFCFRVAGENVLAMRELSCRCAPCLANQWADCEHADSVGKWSKIQMESVSSGGVHGTRAHAKSQRRLISEKRQKLAKQCQPSEYVALESANDQQGFSFWLAKVTKKAWQHVGATRATEHGVKLKNGGWFIEVQYLERFPATSETVFQEWSHNGPLVIDAEAIVAREVAVRSLTNGAVWSPGLGRRSRRAPTPLFHLARQELSRLRTATEVQLSSL